jgi:nicotinamidase-related amidase
MKKVFEISLKKAILLCLVSMIIVSCSGQKQIGNYNNPQRALLVMDMQLDLVGENAKMPIENSVENLIKTVNSIIDDFNSEGYEIIYIRSVFSKYDIANFFRNKACITGTKGIEIDPRVNIVSVNIFDKKGSSAFSNKDFENYLIENQINELYLIGVMAEGCVYKTAIGGLDRKYTVNFIENAVGVWKMKNFEPTKEKLNKRGARIITYETKNASR